MTLVSSFWALVCSGSWFTGKTNASVAHRKVGPAVFTQQYAVKFLTWGLTGCYIFPFGPVAHELEAGLSGNYHIGRDIPCAIGGAII
jgi:hypothetical protein